MSKKGKGKKGSNASDLKFIKPALIQKTIDEDKVRSSIGYPLFSFRWLQDKSFEFRKDDPQFFYNLIKRYKDLSVLGWKEIRLSHKHNYGTEKIPKKQIKAANFPEIVTDDIKEFTVFRSAGDNRAMVGIVSNDIFHVLYIETKFNEIYDHS